MLRSKESVDNEKSLFKFRKKQETLKKDVQKEGIGQNVEEKRYPWGFDFGFGDYLLFPVNYGNAKRATEALEIKPDCVRQICDVMNKAGESHGYKWEKGYGFNSEEEFIIRMKNPVPVQEVPVLITACQRVGIANGTDHYAVPRDDTAGKVVFKINEMGCPEIYVTPEISCDEMKKVADKTKTDFAAALENSSKKVPVVLEQAKKKFEEEKAHSAAAWDNFFKDFANYLSSLDFESSHVGNDKVERHAERYLGKYMVDSKGSR